MTSKRNDKIIKIAYLIIGKFTSASSHVIQARMSITEKREVECLLWPFPYISFDAVFVFHDVSSIHCRQLLFINFTLWGMINTGRIHD